MRNYWRFYASRFLIGMACIVWISLVYSCGNTSIFEGPAGGGKPLTGLTALDDALAQGDFTEALALANTIIQSNTSTANKAVAYAGKGQALLGINGVSSIALGRTIGDKDASSTQNVFALLATLDVTTANLMAAADALNTAHALAAADPATPSLNSQIEFMRFRANVVMCAKLLDHTFDISDDGIEPKSGFTVTTGLDYLFDGEQDLGYFTENASGAYVAFAVDDTESQESLDNITVALENFEKINTAKSGGTPYTYTDGSQKTITNSSSNSDIEDALDYEMKKAK